MKSKSTAGLLALLLGGLGAHKFYLNQPFMGLLYLFFCWTFIPALLGLIEAIVYFGMSDQAFNAKYNAGLLTAPAAAPTIVQVTNTATANGRSVAAELKDLKALRDAGDLTDEEFQSERRKLLGSGA